jgi:hypothetical protein
MEVLDIITSIKFFKREVEYNDDENWHIHNVQFYKPIRNYSTDRCSQAVVLYVRRVVAAGRIVRCLWFFISKAAGRHCTCGFLFKGGEWK